MIAFAWPYLFFLIPLPWMIFKLLPAASFNNQKPLKIPELGDFAGFQSSTAFSRPKLHMLIAALLWLALLTAAARPQWIGQPIEIPQSGRDLMLAVDLSGSMKINDFAINKKAVDRLTASKWVAADFIERRRGDRIGLILFGSQAYLQTPLTFDTSTVKQLLMETEVGLAGNETAIGDAIGLAIKQLQGSPQTSRVLILLTDGNSNAGELSPEKAAEIAAHAKLKIHTIGIGAERMVMQTIFGPQMINPSAEMDEKALQRVAEKTGGRYFRAYNTEDLAQIYQAIDQLESIERKAHYYRPTEEMYFWPLLAALLLSGLLLSYEITMRGQR